MRRPLVLTAIALVCVTNIGALTLGVLNRSADTTDITLTERELRLFQLRSSVTLARIQWMQPSPMYFRDEFVSRAGFAPPGTAPQEGWEVYARRQLHREVFVALEYEGPAWQEYRETVLRGQRRGEPIPMTPLTPEQLEQQRRAREQTIAGHTRLFAIDVDRDAARLRERHPDRSHVLITRARASLQALYDEGRVLVVSVGQPVPDQINIPRPFSVALRGLAGHGQRSYGESLLAPPRYLVHLHYGRFYEPWVTGVEQVR